jgi:hypothetical protein
VTPLTELLIRSTIELMDCDSPPIAEFVCMKGDLFRSLKPWFTLSSQAFVETFARAP